MRSSRSSSHQKFAHAEEIDPYHEDRYDEEMRDEPPRRRWPRRLTALALIAVGAYAYRTYYIEPASTQTPPIITAEETPGVPIPASSDRQSGKLIQERVGALGSREPMVSREESSVEPKTTDPRRITTLAIRPDGTEASAGRFASPPPSTSTPATPSQPRPAQPAARGAPASDASPAPRIAAASSPATAANAAGSGYVVQVSSQRSEADAQASLRSLQAKFPAHFGDRTAIIRRADLGDKGIYYRVVTGPFAAAGEADQFCSSFKAAGGQCIIQRN
jgi:cell division septation protein DedD